MNWDKVNAQQQAAEQRMGDSADREKVPYIKFVPGVHRVRFLPVGNFEEDIPYKTIKQHCVTQMKEGKRVPYFVLCWSWMFESTQRTSTLQPLAKDQKLTKTDASLYQEHGCPFCRAIRAMDSMGVDKQFSANLAAKATNLWNVIKRAQPNTQETDTLFVWSMSNKLHTQVRDAMIQMHNEGVEIFDTTSGFDWSVTATGEGLQRRYAMNMYPITTPVTGEVIPHNLMYIAARSYKTYQETIDLLKVGAGSQLTQIGYKIPGDITLDAMLGNVPQTQDIPTTLPAVESPIYNPVPSSQVVQQRQEVVQKVQQPPQQEQRTEFIDGDLFVDGIKLF